MKLIDFKLVTIICEPVLLNSVLVLTKEFGATGNTLTEVRGEGNGEKRSGEIPDLKLKIEIVAEPELAIEIMKAVGERFFGNYSLITYMSDVQVVRAEKFE